MITFKQIMESKKFKYAVNNVYDSGDCAENDLDKVFDDIAQACEEVRKGKDEIHFNDMNLTAEAVEVFDIAMDKLHYSFSNKHSNADEYYWVYVKSTKEEQLEKLLYRTLSLADDGLSYMETCIGYDYETDERYNYNITELEEILLSVDEMKGRL